MASTIGRIDQNLMRSDLGRPRLGWESFGPVLTQSWVAFWTFVVLTGALGAAFIWYLGGWCYNLRLHWSGATDFDEREGRLVYVFAGLVAALPSLGYALLTTILFPNYQAAWDSKELWSVLLLAFPFCAYPIALGVVGILYTLVTSDAPRATA